MQSFPTGVKRAYIHTNNSFTDFGLLFVYIKNGILTQPENVQKIMYVTPQNLRTVLARRPLVGVCMNICMCNVHCT